MSKRTLSLLFALGGAFLVLSIVLVARLWGSGVYAAVDAVELSTSHVEGAMTRHPFTGEPVETSSSIPWVYALMIDNSMDAWPQSGLDKAFLVMETLAEGRIPRFVAFYSGDQMVEKIGPVRSARPYFIDWASAFGGIFAHVGGSNAALAQLVDADVVDVNQYYLGDYFWRSTDRYAPHNVYTTVELLQEASQPRVEDTSAPDPTFWTFKEDAELDRRPESGVMPTADFGSTEYFVEWSYEREANTYTRSQGGTVMELQDGAIILAHNVIVMKTEMEVLDAVGRRDVRTLGEGEAVVYQDGAAIQATWKKASETSMLQFFDGSGIEIRMNAGSTWIEVIEK